MCVERQVSSSIEVNHNAFWSRITFHQALRENGDFPLLGDFKVYLGCVLS